MKLSIFSCAHWPFASLTKYLLKFFVHFSIGLFASLLLSYKSSLYVLDARLLFSPILWVIFVRSDLQYTKDFNFDDVQLI